MSSKLVVFAKLAVQAYKQKARLQRRLEEADVVLNYWLARVVEEDMEYYIEKTEQIQEEEDKKLVTFFRRRSKR